MSNQEGEEEFFQEESHESGLDSVLLNRFAVFNLPHRPSPLATISQEAAIKPLKKCSSCGGSAKRRSPPPSYEPSSKRAAISTNPSTPNPSPPSSAERKRDVLRRCVSDFPCSPGSYQDLLNPTTTTTLNTLNPLSTSPVPGNSKNPLPPSESQDSQGPASFPMIPRPLYKSPSCPVSSDYEPVAYSTPPRPPALLRPQISNQGSPNSKKLRKLKERFEEMRQWMGKVACEDEEEDEFDHPNYDMINYTSKDKAENQTQDSVWVKETEGGLVLHFQCPCGEGYEIFLHQDKCYYRLA